MFRALWTSNVVSSLGGWMQVVAATWLMTSLTSSPLLVTMVQSASSIPMVLLAIPAGALADIVDLRLILLVSQAWMMSMAAALTAVTLSGRITPLFLLAFTAAMALGTALMGPAFQVVITEIVPPAQVSSAVALNSAGFNLARAIGPAVGGIILARSGASLAFGLNALSFLAVIITVYCWRPETRKVALPAENLVSAIRAGVRYIRYAPALRLVLLRTAGFILFGSAVWALLPLVVLRQFNGGASAYGMFLGCLGLGALTGMILLPALRERFSPDRLIDLDAVVFGAVTLVTALTHSYAVIVGALFIAGIAWITLLSTLNVAARNVVPGWVQARALSAYLLVFQGGTAVGSLIWGAIAERIGLQSSLLCAGSGLLLSISLTLRFSLSSTPAIDVSVTRHWPELPVPEHGNLTTSPVLVTVEYEVDPARSRDFVRLLYELENARRRGGAEHWVLFADPLRPGGYREEFLVESWAEHVRQHDERVTADDWNLQESIRSMQVGSNLPRVKHYLTEEHTRGTRTI